MSKRVYILYTGGTIGMQPSAAGYVPMTGLADLIAQTIPLHLSANMPEYVLEELDCLIDSANANPTDWWTIADRIRRNYDHYDGFIVLHGTDTLAYTASALSFMLRGLRKPVLVTGSQIPLCELRNDAQDNLITALLLACHHPIPEVCLYFNGRLLRGNRAKKVKASGFDAFDSPNHPWLGQVGIHIEINQAAIGEPAADPATPLLVADQEAFEFPDYGRARILPLRMFPGIDAAFLKHVLKQHWDGLLLESYGVGNAPDREPDFLDTLSRATEAGTVVVNLSQCLYGRVNPASYATGAALMRTGVVSGYDMTLEAAFTKLHHLCSLGLEPKQIRTAMAQPRCGELTL